jgi:PAS domain S-box-containing protein
MNERFRELRERALKIMQFDGPVGSPSSAILEDLLTLQAELEIQGEELRESQQRANEAAEHYRQIFFVAPVPFLLLTKNLEIREINRRASDLLGVATRGVNLPFQQFVASEDLPNWAGLVSAQHASLATAEVILRASGGQRLKCRVSMLRRDGGDVLLVIDDVTEMRDVESRHRAMQERYFRILRDSSDAVLIVNADTWLIEELNDAAVAMLGPAPQTQSGTPVSEIFPPAERGRHDLLLRHAMSGRTPPIIALALMSGGGGKVDVEATVGILVEGPTRFLTLVMRDVSWRRLFASDDVADATDKGPSGADLGTEGQEHGPRADGVPNTRPTRRVTPSIVRGSVLLVDDDLAVRQTSSRMLRRIGLSVVEVSSAKDALEVVGAGAKFDVVVSDLTMPDMDGEGLSATLLEANPGQPIVIVTGDIRDDRMRRLQLLGVKRVLTKPYTVPDILSALAPYLPVGPA